MLNIPNTFSCFLYNYFHRVKKLTYGSMFRTSDGYCEHAHAGLQRARQNVTKTNVAGWFSRKGSRLVHIVVYQIGLKAKI